MKGSSEPEAGGNPTPGRQAGVRSLLRETIGRARGTIQAWLRRGQREPTPPRMPVTGSSTERMLQANERLAEWRGVLRWESPAAHGGARLGRHRAAASQASRFSRAIASRYGPAALRALSLALPLARLPRALMSSFPSARAGRADMARPRFGAGHEEAGETQRPASTGMLKPGKVPLLSGLEGFRKARQAQGAPVTGEPPTAMPQPATPRFTLSRQTVEKAKPPLGTLDVARSLGGKLRPASLPLAASREGIDRPGRGAAPHGVGMSSARTLEPTTVLALPRGGPARKAERMAPPPGVERLSTGMLSADVSLWPPGREQIGEPGPPIAVPKPGRPFEGLLKATQRAGPVAEGAPQALLSQRFPRTALHSSTPRQRLGASLPDSPWRRPAVALRGLGQVLVPRRGLARTRAVPALATEGVTLGEAPRAGAAHIPAAHRWGEQEGRQPRIRVGEMSLQRSVWQQGRGPSAPAAEGIGHRQWMPRIAASDQTPTGVSIPKSARPTPMALAPRRSPSRGQEGAPRGEGEQPAPPSPLRRRSAPRATLAPEGRAHRALGLGGAARPQMASSLRDPRLPSLDPLLSWRGLGHGEPLAPGRRRVMERFLGQDLGDVRVHSEPAAARAAAAVKADAFTVGRDVFFGRGQARFDSPSRMALLAHELTHVRQRRGLGGRAPMGVLKAQSEEREAAGNELALRRVLETSQPLALGPVSLPLGLPGLSAREGTSREASLRAWPSQLLAQRSPGAPSMAADWGSPLARAPADRQAADRGGASSAQSAPPAASPPTQPSAAQQGREGDRGLDVEAVAHQVYDWIMRRLAVERERAGYL